MKGLTHPQIITFKYPFLGPIRIRRLLYPQVRPILLLCVETLEH